jgi:hypothetical protein
MRVARTDTARCSFCHKAEGVVKFFVPSPADPDVRICDECLTVCNSIVWDTDFPSGTQAPPDSRGHCLMCDPFTPDLLNTIEQWVIAESQHRQSDVFLRRARRLALSMMGSDPA